MSFNHHQLIARIGNEQGAREEFARLIAALAELTTRVRRIRENPGDWGIDAFAGRLDDGGEVAVWQAKFFINGVAHAQQQQIRDSFRMAREAAEKHGYKLVRWTLALPVDLSAIETQWWDGWKRKREAEHGVTIELWDKHRLDTVERDSRAPVGRRSLPARRGRVPSESRHGSSRRPIMRAQASIAPSSGTPRLRSCSRPSSSPQRRPREPWPT